jgi:hypothetical protein
MTMSIFSKKKFRDRFTVDPDMKSHKSDPFVLEKAERARESFKKYGLPPRNLNKKES